MSSATNSIADPDKEIQASSAIETFSLAGVLLPGQGLTINHEAHILTLSDGEHPVLRQCVLTFSEMCVAVPLLRSHPHYCPYEVLLAHFNNTQTNVTEEIIEMCRRHLHAALAEGVFEHEMRPVRNVISRTRLKLHRFGIDVTSLLETGYLLKPRPVGKKRHIRHPRTPVGV